MPQFYQKIRNSGRNTGYNSQANEVVDQLYILEVVHHPLESGFTLIFMHFHQNSEVLSCCIQNTSNNKVFFAVLIITLSLSNLTAVNFPFTFLLTETY